MNRRKRLPWLSLRIRTSAWLSAAIETVRLPYQSSFAPNAVSQYRKTLNFWATKLDWTPATTQSRLNLLLALLLGAAASVMLGLMTVDGAVEAPLAGQVVTGVGFICAGVIWHQGATVGGHNTTVTISCSAVIVSE